MLDGLELGRRRVEKRSVSPIPDEMNGIGHDEWVLEPRANNYSIVLRDVLVSRYKIQKC